MTSVIPVRVSYALEALLSPFCMSQPSAADALHGTELVKLRQQSDLRLQECNGRGAIAEEWAAAVADAAALQLSASIREAELCARARPPSMFDIAVR
jgi:hypothetical protein